jgi:hypothetical protein
MIALLLMAPGSHRHDHRSGGGGGGDIGAFDLVVYQGFPVRALLLLVT